MGLGSDLSSESLEEAMPGRPVRAYPAILSTSADAFAWARAGAPEGALVVADYQASPRGRAGLPWEVRPGEGLGFSLVLRPELPPEREGWLYTVAVSGIADVLGAEAKIRWPDEVYRHGTRAAGIGVHVELAPQATSWAVVTALVHEARPARGPLLARLVAAIEERYHSDAESVLSDYLPRCETLGRRLRARLIPLGPSGPQVVGVAVNCLDDGALVLETDRGSRVAVRPQNLGLLEEAL
ncbi:MAG: biotin--[acetyl-CoA-carboxylase] ligase [Nitriliruptorales bacterium]